jgi:hypothetical protein
MQGDGATQGAFAMTMENVPLACSLTGLNQARRQEEVAALFATAQEARELADGYAFKFPATAVQATRLVDFILTERDCCPFFTFTQQWEAAHDSCWLRLQGPDGVKAFVALWVASTTNQAQ